MDTTRPADRSAEAAKVTDSKVPDAKNQPRATAPDRPAINQEVDRGHPLAGEPIGHVQHADRAVPNETTPTRPEFSGGRRADAGVGDAARREAEHQERREAPRESPQPPSPKDTARLVELRAKRANPNILPPDVRTEDEEREFRKLQKAEADAARPVVRRPDTRPNPRHRLEALKAKGQNLGEGETIELRRVEDLIRDEARIDELKDMDRRVDEEDQELAMLQQRVTEARAAGGFDPNG